MLPQNKSKASGFSLIEVLIVLGLFAISAAALSSFMLTLQGANRTLQTRADIQDLAREIQTIALDPPICGCQLVGSGALQPSTIAPGTSRVELTQLLTTCAATSMKIAEVGLSLNGYPKVSRIAVDELKPTATPSIYSGTFRVEFTPLPGAPASRPIRLEQNFLESGGKLVGCVAGAANNIFHGEGAVITTGASTTAKSIALCPPGYKPIGGGWKANPVVMSTTCQPRVTWSGPVLNTTTNLWGWAVRMTCQQYKAISVCQKDT